MLKLVLAIAAGVVVALAVIAVKNRHRFRYQPTTLSAGDFAQLAAHPGFTADDLEVSANVRLRGLVRRPTATPANWILFFPGNGGDVLRGAQNLLEQLTQGTGFGVAVWAYRGFDGSDGTANATAFADDAEKVHAHLVGKHGADPKRVHLVSFSLGTAISLRLAGSLTARGTQPPGLVLLSPYDRILVTQNTWWARWSFGDAYDAVARARDSSVEALLVHGALDDAVPITAARTLAAEMGARARLIELPGRGHVDWLSDEGVLKQVREFLVAHTPR